MMRSSRGPRLALLMALAAAGLGPMPVIGGGSTAPRAFGGFTTSRNGRPDTGVARIKRAARKARNQRRNKRAHGWAA